MTDRRVPRGRVQHALDHERRPFELVLGERAEVVGLEAPGDFQLAEVGGVDLIQRRVPRSPSDPRCRLATHHWLSTAGLSGSSGPRRRR